MSETLKTPIGKHPLYKTWNAIRQRCLNPKSPEYHNYGQRGIQLCERWYNFEHFVADMGERPRGMTLDRRENNNGYTPDNCRWATLKQQQRNKRTNRLIEFNGKQMCIVEWAETANLTVGIIMSRLKLGWSIEETLTTPAKWKLRPGQIEQIKARLTARNGAELGREFGVSRGTISLIRNGHIWK